MFASDIAAARTVVVRASTIHGRGVFAIAVIPRGGVVEVCPVLRIPAAQRDSVDATLLFEYYFDWDGDAGIALGFGSLYNHSDAPNAEYLKDFAGDVVTVRAIAEIQPGDEIVFSYTGPGSIPDAETS